MTVKEAIIKALEDLDKLSYNVDIYEKIIEKGYYEFKGSTPKDTVSSELGNFIRDNDSRVKRVKRERGRYYYYLSKNESKIDFTGDLSTPTAEEKDITFKERSLHMLLSSYLKSKGTYSKTIFHEQSKMSVDENQIWTHPDMVGVEFLELKKSTNNLLKAINPQGALKISSYEIKKEINSDSELKKFFFQAVSNSSWANYGYLVAFEFGGNVVDELKRLSQSFGIGVIQLRGNPYESDLLHPAQYRSLDFSTIDKLCKINSEFSAFIEHIEKLMSASDKYMTGVKTEFSGFCDSFLEDDSEVEEYCKEHHIPYEPDRKRESLT